MKLEIKYTYNGNPIKSIEDSLMQILKDKKESIIKEDLEKKLARFENEVLQQGGSVIADIKEDSYSLEFKNISEELREKIRKEWPSV